MDSERVEARGACGRPLFRAPLINQRQVFVGPHKPPFDSVVGPSEEVPSTRRPSGARNDPG